MFNDCVAMLLCYIALAMLMSRRWRLSSIFFRYTHIRNLLSFDSLSVSIKMSTLLFAPAIGLIILLSEGLKEAVICASIMIAIQVELALPFLLANPSSYLTCAFDFGRQFLYQWTVNWKFLPKDLFDNPVRGKILLAIQVFSLILWAWYRFSKPAKLGRKLAPSEIFKLAAECNLIGIICARSLHYQFYSWYFHTVPFMLWSTSSGHVLLKSLLFALTEWCWNVFPATPLSSSLLLTSNMSILVLSLLS
jgi:alpha-1,3-mannosyltransferase